MDPVVSVVVPTFNQSAFIRKALDSVFAQTLKEFEIIVVNNGSTDNTEHILKSYSDQRLVCRYQDNSGSPVGPRNRAIGLAKGEFVAFLDSDDWWLPDKLKIQIDRLRADPKTALVFSDFNFISEDEVLGQNWFSRCQPWRGDVFAHLLERNFIANSTTVVRHSVIDEIGDLDEAYKISHDLDFYLKVASRYQIDYIDQSLVRLRIHASNLTTNRALLNEEIIDVVNKWHKEAVSRRDLGNVAFKRIQARHYFRAGLYRLADGDKARGREHLASATKKHPLNALYFVSYIISLTIGNVLGRIFKFAVKGKGAVANVHK